MLKSKPLDMNADEFLVWNLSQEDKYELVDGVPVLLHEPLHGQAGAAERHDVIVVNLIRRLGNQLDGKRCRPTTSDQAMRTSITKVRRPDVTIECAPRDPGKLESREPIVVFEVLSPSNRPSHIVRKIEEYKRHPTIRHIVLIEPGEITVTRLSLGEPGMWTDTTLTEIGETLVLEPPGIALPLAEIYAGVDPEAGDAPLTRS